MQVHLINPSHIAFGMAVITPRWLYVLAEATPRQWGDPVIADETLEAFDPNRISAGDIVGIGIHTSNALRGYEVGRAARERGAYVVFGGIHRNPVPGGVPGTRRRACGRDGRWRRRLAAGHRGLRGGNARTRLHRRAGGGGVAPQGALGPGAAQPVHVGLGPDRAGLPEALLVLLPSGARTARSRGSATWMPSSKRPSSCAGWDSALSRWRTTTSTRSRSKT